MNKQWQVVLCSGGGGGGVCTQKATIVVELLELTEF